MCHATDCYFCLSKKSGLGRHIKWEYAKVDSVSFTSLCSPEAAHPCSSSNHADVGCEDVRFSEVDSEPSEFEFESERKYLSQEELSDWIRDLELTKEKSELLASRMQQKGFLSKDVKVSYYRTRHERFAKYFQKQECITFCNDLSGLFEQLHQVHVPQEWRLFIDSNKESLKAVLLHNGNKMPSIPVAHAVNSKETYETMATLLEKIQYKQHQWQICCDLKVVAILCGLQGGYTKYCCFLCLWDSRADSLHYKQKKWPERVSSVLGQANVKYEPLVHRNNIILPPLHIKLGLIKNFIKKLDNNGAAFAYLRSLFKNLSHAKIKEGVFAGPEVKKLLKDEHFTNLLSPIESAAWHSFRLVVTNFLGNNKSPDYKKIVQDLIKNYAAMGKYLFSKHCYNF